MSHTLILGGGFGGVAAARRLRSQLSAEHRITLIDRRAYFMVGFRKTWALIGKEPAEKGQRSLAELRKFGIEFIQSSIDSIDPEAISVAAGGRQYRADAMIVALGAELDPHRVPGFDEHALSVYDPDAISEGAARIRDFDGGSVLIGVFAKPYKCPPAPYELAILLQEHLDARGIPASLTVFTPLPVSMPVLDEASCQSMDSYMIDRGIGFLTEHAATRVESDRVHFENGTQLEYDLLLGVAPHRPPSVVRDGGLTGPDQWVQVDPFTLETAYPNVYAIGDVTAAQMGNGKPLPKAGVFAEGGGIAAADRIAAILQGKTPSARNEGNGGCFVEIGGGQAVMIDGRFLAPGGPQAELTEPSDTYLADKWEFERSRLTDWFD